MPRVNKGETFDVRGTIDMTNAESVLARDGQWSRNKITEESLAEDPLLMTDFRVHDDLAALLPGTASGDDLAIIEGGTGFGTDAPTVRTSDAANTTVTQRARIQYKLTDNYQAGQDVVIRLRAGMITTVANGTATIDVECYQHDEDGAVGSDLCQTGAQSINSLTKANLDFTINPATLAPGDMLDIRVTIAITDSATGTAVIGELSRGAVRRDIKG